MTDMKKVLLFISDYTDQGNDQFFLWSEEGIVEVDALKLVQETCEIVCHDYWLIAPIIFRKTKNLPPCVTDVEELRISTSGRRKDREARDKVDISRTLLDFIEEKTLRHYKEIFNRKAPPDIDVFAAIAPALLKCANKIEENARDANEWNRFMQVERPVADYLIRSAADGIAICEERLRAHKARIEFEYYMALKNFSAKYDMPLEVPSDAEIINHLEPKGFDFSGVNVDYVLNFVPMQDKFAEDLLHLQKIARSRKVLASIPFSQKRIFPIVDCFGSITSRIYFKDPSLQNLAKHHRDILNPDTGKSFSYVDYDQYEAGIMAALSGDQKLLEFYAERDVYEVTAEQIFNDRGKRKEAKRLFLSYAYGMKRKNLIDAAYGYGAERRATRKFFEQFTDLEKWKESVAEEFKQTHRIGTSLGNYLHREQEGDLTDKEKRSAVSQVVQGTASLIFKKALLELRSEAHVQLKVPMHDAALFQHPQGFNTIAIVKMFSHVMSAHFGNLIKGKASLARFFPNPN